MIAVKGIKSIIKSVIPSDSKRLYDFFLWYVNRFNNDNNGNIITNGEYHFLVQVLPACRTVFDVGANFGDWAELSLTINPQITLYCFEPSEATYQLLISKTFPPTVICNNIGLSSNIEDRILYVFGSGSGLNSLYQREGLEKGWGINSPEDTELIHLDTLDHYCHEKQINEIDLLKIDVEGHELEVLKGASQMLKEGKIKFIQFEYGGCNIDARIFLKDLFALLQQYSYSLYKIYPTELRYIDRYDQRLENFQYQNWVAKWDPITTQQ